MSIAITTRSYDNLRSGANTQETVLTPANVKSRGIKLLFLLPLPNDKRGCEAQPLIVPSVKIGNRERRDIVYVATMANDVVAFDANVGAQLWKVNLGTPINGTAGPQGIDRWGINDHWGILSTPVIDLNAEVMYACSWTSPDGSPQQARHVIHAISLRDGAPVHQPLDLQGTEYSPGHGLPKLLFNSLNRKQRAALLLANGALFIAFGTVHENDIEARGWIIVVDTASFRVSAVWTSTARGSGGGIWQAGAGPAADAAGNIYVMTGNGDFDGVTDFGESIIKLRYTPPRSNHEGALSVVDWWTPWTDDQRVGQSPATSFESMPSNFRPLHYLAAMGAAPQAGDWKDMDLGSGGPVLVPTIGAVLAGGKDGILYTVNLAKLGKTKPTDLNPVVTAQNYAKLKSSPIFYTYYPGPQLSPAPGDISTLNVNINQRTYHLHGTPVVWNSKDHGLMHFCWGENSALRAWALDATGRSTYLAGGAEIASVQATTPLGGMPGGMLSLSANGRGDGIVWASIPYGDANTSISAGRFLAYDASNFAKFPDGSGWIKPLWDSEQWNWHFSHNKFNRPIVWNGRVFLPTYDGEVLVLGLA
jgi:outer membrane protein assembly factor BamB